MRIDDADAGVKMAVSEQPASPWTFTIIGDVATDPLGAEVAAMNVCLIGVQIDAFAEDTVVDPDPGVAVVGCHNLEIVAALLRSDGVVDEHDVRIHPIHREALARIVDRKIYPPHNARRSVS